MGRLTAIFGIAWGLFSLGSLPGHARDCRPGEIGEYQHHFELERITGYIPALGGTNGRPGTSASGVAGTNYSFQKYMKGKANVVMVAVPRPTRRDYFKTLVRVPALEKHVGKCVIFFVGDTYGESSNDFGVFGKMDVLHDLPEENADMFDHLRNTDLYVVAGAQQVKGKRVILRDPRALLAENNPIRFPETAPLPTPNPRAPNSRAKPESDEVLKEAVGDEGTPFEFFSEFDE
jgi:hypothetical protein